MKFLLPCLLWVLAFAARADADLAAARDAYLASDESRLIELGSRLADHPLGLFAEYWLLLLRLPEASGEEVAAFIDKHQDSHLSERLRGEWLKYLGESGDWETYLREYAQLGRSDTQLDCYAFRARIALGDERAAPEAKELWATGRDMPESCTPLFGTLFDRKLLTTEDVWARLRLALQAGNANVARRVAQRLDPAQAKALKAISRVTANPKRYLDKRQYGLSNRAGRELALFAVLRVARSDPRAAAAYWRGMETSFSARDRQYGWARLAGAAVFQQDPVALSWFRKVGDAALDDELLIRKARAGLRASDWGSVEQAVAAMSPAARNEAVWRYWRARALKVRGKDQAAEAMFKDLAEGRGYYALLAGEELGRAAATLPVNFRPTLAQIAAVENLPAVQRALRLQDLGMRQEAVREWLWAVRKFDDEHLLTAAEVAHRHRWYDRAINTAERTVEVHNYGLRYLAPFRERMRPYTRGRGLDEAWVYGLIRQESRFIMAAQSSVGASGLMQLMPATARWCAQKLGVEDFRPSQVNDLDTNLNFGTFYLSHVQDRFGGDPVLATAAYNAGPGRAERWRADVPLEGAVYVETIPFNETRGYVRNVMENAMNYAAVFGHKPMRLKERLGVIPGRGLEVGAAPAEQALMTAAKGNR